MRPTTRNPPCRGMEQGKFPVISHNFENHAGYWLPLVLLLLVPLTGLLLEGARINAAQPKLTEWAYIGRNIARIEGALGASPCPERTADGIFCLWSNCQSF